MAAIVHETRGNEVNIRILSVKSGLCECLYDPGPRPGEIPAVISAATGCNYPPAAVPIGQLAKPAGCQRVRLFRVLKMRDRIPFQAVGATLQNDELRFPGIDKRLDSSPGFFEFLVAGARRHRHV